jgi:ParB-like chromosome segregation protein Spo0J
MKGNTSAGSGRSRKPTSFHAPAKNARTHTDAQVAAIAASIKEWGWTTPALVGEDGGLIAGHARVLAARQLGIAKIPVMVAAGWTEAQKRAYVLADNQLAITGSGWDPELLRLELGELKLSGFDLSLTGFGDLELKDIMADRTEGLTDPDDAPEAPEHPVSQTGDLWLLGRHRLLCGDSTVATDVERTPTCDSNVSTPHSIRTSTTFRMPSSSGGSK